MLVKLMMRPEGRFYAVMIKKHVRCPGILGKNEVSRLKYLHGTYGDITKVADGGGYKVQLRH
jgi:hypothetical protein